jgi:hypothetical protein
MSNQTKALELTKKALDLLLAERQRHLEGNPTVGVLTQLESCRNQLEKMLIQLSNKLPPPNERLSGMGHMVGDSWPINNPLGIAFLEAEQAYKKAT